MEAIEILFKEYDTLRAEIIARQDGAYQALLVAGAAIAWFSKYSGRTLWLVMGALLLVFVMAGYRLLKDIYLISERLAQLEAEINHLAGAVLLKWNAHSGWVAYLRDLFKPKSK